MSPPERDLLAELPEEITVYRGFAHPSARDGLSYTLDPDVAAFFASRGARGDHDDAEPRVLSGRVRRGDVLALLLSRHELELVLDPDDVTVGEDLPASDAAAERHSRLLGGDRVALDTRLDQVVGTVTER